MTRVVIVNADTWQALYVENKCVYQHHEVELEHLKKYVPGVHVGAIEEVYLTNEGYEGLHKARRFPEAFSSIPAFWLAER